MSIGTTEHKHRQKVDYGAGSSQRRTIDIVSRFVGWYCYQLRGAYTILEFIKKGKGYICPRA
jgi:hypothetical protein